MGTTKAQLALRAAFNENAKPCANCLAPILVKDGERIAEARKKKFCSRSCAATFNNAAGNFPKRGPIERTCKRCPNTFFGPRLLCKECRLSTSSSRVCKKDPNSRRRISYHAKQVVKKWPKVCDNCGYDKHVEVCHIKPIADFADNVPARIMNEPSNLILLCPNCHWEFDNGITLILVPPG